MRFRNHAGLIFELDTQADCGRHMASVKRRYNAPCTVTGANILRTHDLKIIWPEALRGIE